MSPRKPSTPFGRPAGLERLHVPRILDPACLGTVAGCRGQDPQGLFHAV